MGEVKDVGSLDAEEIIRLAASGRTPLAKALLEDESWRIAREKELNARFNEQDEIDSRMPFWAWAILYFALGILFSVSVQNLGMFVYKLIAKHGGSI
jgi:hypothetical protein